MRTFPHLVLVIVLAMLASGSLGAATVWKWVDKNGVTHYSDQPVPGAVQVDLLNVQTYDAREATIPTTTAPRPTAKAAPATYRSIEVTSPANDETLTGTGGQVSISVRVQPGVQPGDSVQFTMDGQLVSEPDSTATSLVLKDVPRGAHTVSVSVVSRDGRSLIQSSPITFYMQQQSILRKR